MYEKSAKKFDIVTFGSITLDTFVEPSEMKLIEQSGKKYYGFEVGQKIRMRTVAKHIGGSAANSSVGFSKMGLSVACVGTIGYDDDGHYILHQLEKRNVDTDYIQIQPKHPSASSIIVMQTGGDRTVLNEKTLTKSLPEIPQTRSLYCGHLTEEEARIFPMICEWKQSHPEKIFAWNPGKTQFRFGFDSFTDVFACTDLLILNVEEALLFTGLKTSKKPCDGSLSVLGFAENAPKELCELRPVADKFLTSGVKNVIITDGRDGSYFFSADKALFLPMVDVRPPVSTLGAGDSFSVAAIVMFLEDQSPENMMFGGSFNATSVIRFFGSQNGLLTREELEQRLMTV